MRIPRAAQRRSIRLSREAVLSISRRSVRTSVIIFSRASKGKAEDFGVGAVLIIALPAPDDDSPERLIEAAGGGIVLVDLQEKLFCTAGTQCDYGRVEQSAR